MTEAQLKAVMKQDHLVLTQRRRATIADYTAPDIVARRGRGPDQAKRQRMSPTAETRAKLSAAAKRRRE